MNVHQLELFYHVVVHQGVSQAARVLDKEQPTLSKQINDLEDALRVKLYFRRPFKLTEKGEVLFRSIEPFFQQLPKLEEMVKGGDLLRIGASPIVLMHHLPAVEQAVRKTFPKLHLLLREASQPQLLQMLDRGEIDLAITLLPAELPAKVFSRELLRISPTLIVPKKSHLASAEALWAQPEIEQSLICLTADEMLCRTFQQELKRRDLEWRPRIEVGSLGLVEHYVQLGYGIGLSLRLPGVRLSPKLRALELPGFPDLPLGMLWRDDLDKLLRAFRAEVQNRAAQISHC